MMPFNCMYKYVIMIANVFRLTAPCTGLNTLCWSITRARTNSVSFRVRSVLSCMTKEQTLSKDYLFPFGLLLACHLSLLYIRILLFTTRYCKSLLCKGEQHWPLQGGLHRLQVLLWRWNRHEKQPQHHGKVTRVFQGKVGMIDMIYVMYTIHFLNWNAQVIVRTGASVQLFRPDYFQGNNCNKNRKMKNNKK